MPEPNSQDGGDNPIRPEQEPVLSLSNDDKRCHAEIVSASRLSLSPDITEFALRKSIVRALKIFHGLG
jgi:hypothetical protein